MGWDEGNTRTEGNTTKTPEDCLKEHMTVPEINQTIYDVVQEIENQEVADFDNESGVLTPSNTSLSREVKKQFIKLVCIDALKESCSDALMQRNINAHVH